MGDCQTGQLAAWRLSQICEESQSITLAEHHRSCSLGLAYGVKSLQEGEYNQARQVFAAIGHSKLLALAGLLQVVLTEVEPVLSRQEAIGVLFPQGRGHAN